MIQLKLCPDAGKNLPAEARNHAILADDLSEVNDKLPDDPSAPIDSWRDVERVVPGHGQHIELRLPGSLSDYPSDTQTIVRDAVLNSISDLRPHPDGWTEVS
jgi:hypothetical protein